MSDRATVIKQLQETPAKLRELTASSSEREIDFRLSTSDWSTREVLAHLVDDEMFVMRNRLERIASEDNPHLQPHDEQHWHATRNTSRDELSLLLEDFATQRAASVNIMVFLREADWQRLGFQPEIGSFSAEQWLDHWIEHDQVHLAQIAANLAAAREQR